MSRHPSQRTLQLAAAAVVCVVVVVFALVLALTGGSGSSGKGGAAGQSKAGLTIEVSDLKGAALTQVSVHAELADAKGQVVQRGILTVKHKLTVNPLPPSARILAISVGDCARIPVVAVKPHGRHRARTVHYRVDCQTYTHASGLAPIKLSGGPQTVQVGLYCVRPGGAIDCSASRISVKP